MQSIEQKVESLLLQIINNLGYDLYDVEYVKEGKEYYLRVYIDSDKGIDLNDCEKVSREIDTILDKEDYMQEQYFLEVSSPGLERVLRKDKHLKQNIGKEVEIKLFKMVNGKKSYQGILKDFNQDKIILLENEKDIELERKSISKIKTIFNWEKEGND